MGVACDVYTKLLFKRGHGHPLWEPEPTQSGEVLIGDVGYMLDGGFYRLFNATLPADHPLHEPHGVPDGYEPLSFPDTLRHHRPHALQAGPICSKSVTAVNADASLEPGTGTLGPLAHIRFKFSDEQGAVLVLKHDAHREALHPCRDLTQYVLRNHAGWHEFARNVCRLDLRSQDIVFVCGSVKTAEWALAAATHRARDGEIAFGADLGPPGQASFSVSATKEVSMSWEHRRGPKGGREGGEGENPAKFDQCVFLHYYKVKHRPFFVPKVIRGATEEEHSSRSSSPNGSDHMALGDDGGAMSQVEIVPKPIEQGDIVDAMLDYILDQTDTTCAIVSDRDIAMLSSNAGDIPDSLPQLLAGTPPTLTVTGGVGMLPCHNAALDSAIHTHGGALPTIPPMVQFVAGPPRVLPHYPAWSASLSRSRSRRSRSRSQSAARALSPPSWPYPPFMVHSLPRVKSHSLQFSQSSRPSGAPVPAGSTLQLSLPQESRSPSSDAGGALRCLGRPCAKRFGPSPPSPGMLSDASRPLPQCYVPPLERLSLPCNEPTYEQLLETPFVRSSQPGGLYGGGGGGFLFAADDDEAWEEVQPDSSAAGPSSAGATALPSSSSSSLLRIEDHEAYSSGAMEGSVIQPVGILGEFEGGFEGGSMDGSGGDVPPPARLEPDELPMGNSIGPGAWAQLSLSRGKGKGKEVARSKRTRSPSDDGEDGEDEDERPAKKSRKESN